MFLWWKRRRLLPLIFLFTFLLIVCGSVLYEPNNFDGLTVRIPRVLYWMGQHHWYWIKTPFPELNYLLPNYEWLTVPIFLATGGFHAAVAINWISFLFLPSLFFTLLRAFGTPRRLAWDWMWIFPSGYLIAIQAGSISNDLPGLTAILAALVELEKNYRSLLVSAKKIISNPQPIGSSEVGGYIRKIETDGVAITARIDEMQEKTTNKVLQVIQQGEGVEKNLIRYHVTLIVLSVLASIFLIVRIRRAITAPFNSLIMATEKLGSGDFSYRISMDRTDEFGKVAAGFNSMATELEESNRKVSQKL